MNLYTKVKIAECLQKTGKKPIAVRWIDVKKGAKLIVSDPMQLSEGENVALLEICGTYHPSYCRREPFEPPPLSPLFGSIMKLTTARLVELPQDPSMMLTHCVLFVNISHLGSAYS